MIPKRNAQIIANWWTDQLRKAAPPRIDNGEIKDKEFDAMAELMGLPRPAANQGISDDQLKTFKRCLTWILLREEDFDISVDYDPDGWLLEAAEVAGIDLGYKLPIKTVTLVETLQVREGYSGELKDIEIKDHWELNDEPN